MQSVAGVDLDVARAARQLASRHWPAERVAARSCEDAIRTGRTYLTDDADAVIRAGGIEVIIEATGDPRTGIRLALAAIAAGIPSWSARVRYLGTEADDAHAMSEQTDIRRSPPRPGGRAASFALGMPLAM